MKIGNFMVFHKERDGGPESKVMGFWLIQIKSLFTIALLKFEKGSRETFHNHAFNSISWLLSGCLREVEPERQTIYSSSIIPIITRRSTLHKVYGLYNASWVLTVRGPWSDSWKEIDTSGKETELTHHRIKIG